MAREPSVLDETAGAVDRATEGPVGGGKDGLLDRRSYLQLAGAGAVVSAAGLATGAVSADDDYEVVEIDPGERLVVDVDSGETLENVLYDQSANGAQVTIVADGTDWVIRNIGIRGPTAGDGVTLGCWVTDSEGTGLVENVYAGDGAVAGHRSGLGLWVAPEHRGHLDIRNVNIQGMGDNSFYCSAPGGNGTVDFEGCYSKDSWVSHYRLARGSVTNCVAVNTGEGDDGRGLWAWNPGEIEVDDCHFDMNGRHYSFVVGANNQPSNVTVRNTEYDTGFNGGTAVNGGNLDIDHDSNGTTPEDVVPDDCPTSAEAAASGESGEGSSPEEPDDSDDEEDEDDELSHVLLFRGSDDGVSRYEFEVDGTVEPSTDEGATIDEEAGVDGGNAHGVVANWKDAFRFDGDLEQLTVDGPATVSLDDEEIDPSDYGDELPKEIEIVGSETPAWYQLTVDGEIEYDGDEEPDDDAMTVSGSTVESALTDETHRFRFAGAITDVSVSEDDVDVVVDGDSLDLDEIVDAKMLPHAIVIDGTEADEPSTYSFRVDGRVIKSAYNGASIDDEDVIEGETVRGGVSNWLDAYWFDGDVEDLTVLGGAAVHVEYNAREQ